MEEEEEERKPARVGGEESERNALMGRGSLREKESCGLVCSHGHGRPWSLGGASARGEEVGEGCERVEEGVECPKMRSKRWGGGRPSPFYRGRGVAASSLIGGGGWLAWGRDI
jgi:hypothetical protein